MAIPICSDSCSGNKLPALANTLCSTTKKRDGGICRLIFLTCVGASKLPTIPVLQPGNVIDRAAWEPIFASCDARLSPKVKGSKPKGATEKARFDSCSPEEVIGRTITMTIEDYTAYENLSDYEFWDYIYRNQSNLSVGFWTGDGLFYGFHSFAVDVDEEIGDTIKTKKFKAAEFTIETGGEMLRPDVINGLLELALEYQSYDCGSGGYVYDGAPVTTYADLLD